MLNQKLKAFPCTECGACCRHIYLSEITSYLNRGDGICHYLNTSTNLCTVYEKRPDICRVELQYIKNYSQQVSWDEFIKINVTICKQLQNGTLVKVE